MLITVTVNFLTDTSDNIYSVDLYLSSVLQICFLCRSLLGIVAVARRDTAIAEVVQNPKTAPKPKIS